MEDAAPLAAAAPRLEDHFVPSSLIGLLRRRHPYDFVETYRTLRRVYGYEALYVNLGYWPDGAATVEPGRRLAELCADELRLPAGGRLIDAGAGLGQAAVDLCARHALGEVLGINRSARQVGFANALARAHGLADRVRHTQGCACAALAPLAAEAWDGVLAVECVGHFPAPEDFLRDAARALRPGGRIAFCLNVARRPPTAGERLLMGLAYGFVPAPLATWEARLAAAGFRELAARDLTDLVLQPMTEVCLGRLDREGADLGIPWGDRLATGVLLRGVQRAVARGRLGYALVSATR